jgi:tRNA uridine 5-carboxymethylaminomethyl modification enzyme
LSHIVKRTNIQIKDICQFIEETIRKKIFSRLDVVEQIEFDTKYEGYINRQQEQIDRFIKLEDMEIPEELEYVSIPSLSIEGRERLIRIRPRSIGQAVRISGVTHSDISVISVYLRRI